MPTNLPSKPINDSLAGTKIFFDSYGKTPIEFGANDVNSTIGFFTDKGFSSSAAQSFALIILRSAKEDNVPVFNIIDRMKSLNRAQLDQLVAALINSDRVPTSKIGIKTTSSKNNNIERNIIP